ncbi:O-antigen ligase family protein [Oribacterium sp. HCP28S3_H8]|uniref:O-antigen ligase family protein n=1 Tax=Oribacterium sp. HCP28S3_H8 TaxID=3438945 RepID=UPI003F8AC8D7
METTVKSTKPKADDGLGNGTPFQNFASHIMDIYVLVMLCVFPLYTHDGYYDILKSRFDFFWRATCITAAILLIAGVFYFISGRKGTHKMEKGGILQQLNPASLWKKLSVPDRFLLLLIFIYFISFALSGYPYETWWGNLGRYQGLLNMLMIGLLYFMITRFYHYKARHIKAFQMIGLLMCLWGITDFFKMDIFGFFSDVTDVSYMERFASSIGNINMYTTATAMLLALSTTLFILEKSKIRLAVDFVCMVAAAFASIMGLSDNFMLSIVALYGALPFFTWRSGRELLKYFISVTVLIAAAKVSAILSMTEGITTIANIYNMGLIMKLGTYPWFSLVLMGCIVITLGIAIAMTLRKLWDAPLPKWIRKIWAGLCIVAFSIVIFAFFDANVAGHQASWEKLGLSNAIVFNDAWGTGRGLNWRMAMDYFVHRMPLLKKLFGYGPDSYYMIAMDNFFDKMAAAGYGMFDAAHNEYLNYLITVGIAGLVVYLLFMISMICAMVRFLRQNTGDIEERELAPEIIYVTAAIMVIITYMAQAFINIAVAIVAPLLYIMFSIGMAVSQKKR